MLLTPQANALTATTPAMSLWTTQLCNATYVTWKDVSTAHRWHSATPAMRVISTFSMRLRNCVRNALSITVWSVPVWQSVQSAIPQPVSVSTSILYSVTTVRWSQWLHRRVVAILFLSNLFPHPMTYLSSIPMVLSHIPTFPNSKLNHIPLTTLWWSSKQNTMAISLLLLCIHTMQWKPIQICKHIFLCSLSMAKPMRSVTHHRLPPFSTLNKSAVPQTMSEIWCWLCKSSAT